MKVSYSAHEIQINIEVLKVMYCSDSSILKVTYCSGDTNIGVLKYCIAQIVVY